MILVLDQPGSARSCSTSPLAVTWLTVYRQLHIPAQGGLAATLAHKNWAPTTFDARVLAIHPSHRHDTLGII